MGNAKKNKSFLIYNDATKEIAKHLYKLFTDDKKSFAFLNPVLFEADKGTASDFTEYPDYIQSVNFVIVPLNGHVFGNFTDKEDEKGVFQMELEEAFKQGKNVIPIQFGNDPKWEKITDEKIRSKIVGVSNKKIADNIDDLSKRNADIYQDFVRYLRGRAKLNNDLRDYGVPIEINTIKRDLRNIYNKIIKGVKTIRLEKIEFDKDIYFTYKNDENLKYRFEKEHEGYNYIPHSYIYGYKPLFNKEKEVCLGSLNICELCKLDYVPNDNEEKLEYKDKKFVYWDIDCDADRTNAADKVSVCAICFGLLMLVNCIHDKDFLIDFKPPLIEINEHIANALRMLLTFRDGMEYYWMSEWKLMPDSKKNSGTINQTTLSISTLLILGFLKNDNAMFGQENEADNYRKLVVKNSADWLIEKMKSAGYWGSEKEANFTLTAVAFETLLKYAADIAYLEDSGVNVEKLQFCRKNYSNINDVLKCVIEFIHQQIEEDTIEKLTWKARYLKAFCAFLEKFSENKFYKDSGIIQLVKSDVKILLDNFWDFENGPLSSYSSLCERVGEEIFEEFPLNNNDDEEYEEFENCSELIIVDSLIKALPFIEDFGAEDEKYRIRKESVLNRLGSLLNDFRNDRVLLAGDFVVKGKRKSPTMDSPIYAMYYYRMALYDYYVECMKGKGANEQN